MQECQRLDDEVHKITDAAEKAEQSDGNRTECLSQRGVQAGISEKYHRTL